MEFVRRFSPLTAGYIRFLHFILQDLHFIKSK